MYSVSPMERLQATLIFSKESIKEELRHHQRKGDMKLNPTPKFTLEFNSAMMKFNDALDDRQAEAGTTRS